MSADATSSSPAREHENGRDDPILAPGHTFTTVSDRISSIVLNRPYSRTWLIGFGLAFLLVNALFLSLAYLLSVGVGIWGIKVPVMWGFAIVNFVWWIGIGHAGTLISAILLLLKQDWRTSINRFAEAMTLFAVSCAGLFPLIHMGRWWVFYWLLPYPNTMGMWPQWRSPLVWDAFAVSTYATVSLLFWYIGLLPDMATLRDRAKNRLAKYAYGFLSMGWRGSARHWARYRTAYMLMAALATPLVVSVHTIVSWDFSVAIVPGWHSTIFPPYFVAGAIYSGFAMVLTLAIPLRSFYNLKDFITDKHLDNMAKVLLATGLVVCYGYATEAFMGWYGENKYDRFMLLRERPFGYYAHTYWSLIATNCVAVQCMWFPACRRNVALLWTVSIIVNVGMWLERYVIIITSLSKDYLPSSWDVYHGTTWDYLTYYGTIGLFAMLIFLFIRFLPAISIAEMRELVHETGEAGAGPASHPAEAEHR